MSEVVTHELVTVTADEAGRLEEEFLNGLDQAQDAFVQIMETNAWAALGHASFADWWSARVVPVMRALSMRPTPEITNRVLEQVRKEEAELPRTQQRTQRELADLAGTSEWTVAGRKKAAQDRPHAAVPERTQGDGTLGTSAPRSRTVTASRQITATVDRDEFDRIDAARRSLPGDWSMADLVRKAVFEYVRTIESTQGVSA